MPIDPEHENNDDEDATNEGVSATDPVEGPDDEPLRESGWRGG